jgi:hypothetical protein
VGQFLTTFNRHVLNAPQQGGEVVYIADDPKAGYQIAGAGLPCVISFTPDQWSGKDHLPSKDGGNLALIAKNWLDAGYQVAIPVGLDLVSQYAQWFINSNAIILPVEMPITAFESSELAELLPPLWHSLQPDTPEWLEPLPLDENDTPKPFPLEAMPQDLQDLMNELHGYYKTPIPLIAGSIFPVLAIAGQSLANINIDDTMIKPLSLFTLVIAESGERKSEIDKVLSKPLHDWERDLQRDKEAEAKQAKASKKSWVARGKGLEDAIKRKSTKGESTTQLEQQLIELEQDEPQDVIIPSLLMQDQTPEGMAQALQRYPSAGLLSSEAGIVLGGHGMSNDTAVRNMGILNDLWSGQPVKITRAKAESFSLYQRRITVGLAVQPSTLAAFGKNTDARGIGFFSRFMLAHPESTRGQRLYTKPPQWQHLPKFRKRITDLLDIQQEPDTEHGGLDLFDLELHPKALEIWIAGYNEIESGLKPHGEYTEVGDVASKTADNAARIAGLFHLYHNGLTGRVTEQEMQSGMIIARWYLHEALRYFTNATKPANIRDADNLERCIISKCKDVNANAIERRVIMQNVTPKSLRTAQTFNTAIELLKLHHRIRVGKHEGKEAIFVNPALLPIQQQNAA